MSSVYGAVSYKSNRFLGDLSIDWLLQTNNSKPLDWFCYIGDQRFVNLNGAWQKVKLYMTKPFCSGGLFHAVSSICFVSQKLRQSGKHTQRFGRARHDCWDYTPKTQIPFSMHVFCWAPRATFRRPKFQIAVSKGKASTKTHRACRIKKVRDLTVSPKVKTPFCMR